MSRFVLLLGFCLSATALAAQIGTWYSINLYPNYSDRRIIIFENFTQDQVDRIDSLEAAKPSYSVGGAIQWRGEFLGFQLGLNFVNTGYRKIRQAIPSNDPFFGQADEYQQAFTNYLLEIPAEITFYQSLNDNNEVFFMLGTGIAYNLGNRTRTVLFTEGGRQTDASPSSPQAFRPFNFEFQAALGWEKAFSPTLRLVVQPHFQFWMRGLYYDELVNRNLYSLGVRVGLKFGRLVE